jgi:hypothetical protein
MVVGRNTGACIGDGDAHLVLQRFDAHRDSSALGGELDRIGEEIGQHLDDAVLIDQGQHRLRGTV